jgi:hypothetical protein
MCGTGTEVRIKDRCTSTPPYVCMVSSTTEHRGRFTFNITKKLVVLMKIFFSVGVALKF